METKNKLVKTRLRENKRNLLIGLFTLLGVILLISLISWYVLRPEKEVLQGEMEAREVRISGKLAGRILKINVEEGDTVSKGDTLVVLSSPELLAKLAQAEASEDAALSQNLKALRGTRQEQIDGAFEMWQKAKAGTLIARKTFDRIKQLYESEVVTAQKMDEAEASYTAALATEKAAKSQYDMALNGAQQEDKQLSLAMLNRAKGAVSEVEAYLPEIHLIAPVSGEVSEIVALEGELLGQGAPVMNLVDMAQIWLVLQVKETQLHQFKMGAITRGRIPALENQTVQFKVNYIKALGSYATWKATKTTGDFDVKTFEIHAKPLQSVTGLRPGMSILMEE